MAKILCLVVILQSLTAVFFRVQSLKIISIVSNSSDRASAPLWGRGEEIMSGALLAAKHLNSNQDVLSGFHVEVVPLFVQDCSVSEGILKTVRELLSTNNPIIGVTGLFCVKLMRVLSPLLNKRGILLTAQDPTGLCSQDPPHIYDTSLNIRHQMKILFALMKALNWNKFNLVTTSEEYYAKIAETVYGSATAKYFFKPRGFWLNSKSRDSIIQLIRQLKRSTSPITVAALPQQTAAELLCHAFRNKLTWPRYGWVMLDLTVNESAQCSDGESLLKAMENVIVLQTKLEQNDSIFIFNVTNKTRSSQLYTFSADSYTHNPYASVLYEFVWALALAVNSSLTALQQSNSILTTKTLFGTPNKEEIDKAGASYNFQNGEIHISVEAYQIQNESNIFFWKQTLCNNNSLLEIELLDKPIPQDDIPRIHQFVSSFVTIVLLLGIGICVVFVTVLLVLFLCYWRKSEVRATSRVLSLFIFLGSYMLLVSAFCYSGINIGTCRVYTIATTSYSLGTDIVLATVLAKTLRITYIFNIFKKLDWTCACSDCCLIVLIISIISGKGVLLIVWNALESFNVHTIESPVISYDKEGLPFYSIEIFCDTEQPYTVWHSIIAAYSLCIAFALVVLAIKTRKIKRNDFKDTKKINGLLFFLLIVGIVCMTLGFVFDIVGEFEAQACAVSGAFTAIPALCQVFLIIPKIGPSLKRSVNYHITNCFC